MWVLLDVDPDLTVTLMELQLRFADWNLLASRAWAHRPDVVTTVADTLGAMWRVHKWIESRWLTGGTSARIFLAGIMTGVGGLVKEICDSGVRGWYVKGLLNIKEDHLQILALAVASCRVSEALQQELMRDSRVAPPPA